MAGSRGVLIAVEGMDGSGKSTQAKLLYSWLRAKGMPVHHTEWNSSPVVRTATKAGKTGRRLLPITFHMIHAADFADRYAQQIEPMLEVGGSSSATGTSSRPWRGMALATSRSTSSKPPTPSLGNRPHPLLRCPR